MLRFDGFKDEEGNDLYVKIEYCYAHDDYGYNMVLFKGFRKHPKGKFFGFDVNKDRWIGTTAVKLSKVVGSTEEDFRKHAQDFLDKFFKDKKEEEEYEEKKRKTIALLEEGNQK